MKKLRLFMLFVLASALMMSVVARAQDEVVLSFWFEGESPATVALFEEAIERFVAQYPIPVRVEITAFSFDDMLRTMPLALDGGTGPDIAAVPPLTQGSDRYALAGHLVDLTDIAVERGWTDNYSAAVLAYNNAGTPGQIFGVPYALTTVGVYYNSEIFAELGLEVPQTFEEFEAVLAAIKDAGIVPITVGALDGWPLDHVWSQIVHTNIDIEHIARLEMLDPDVAYDAPEMIEASEKLLEWAQLGYLDPNMLSTSYADSNAMFISGEAAMSITGTWAQADFTDQPQFAARFFPMPQYNPELPWSIGGSAPYNNIIVPNGGDHIDIALDFMDYLLSEENMRAFWDAGILVSFQFEEVPPPGTALQGDIYASMLQGGPGYYHGVVSAAVQRAAWVAHQDVVSGALPPAEALAELQRVYLEEVELANR